MKKKLCVILTMVIALLSFPTGIYAYENSEILSGYKPVSDKFEFIAIAKNPSGKYYLTRDIVFNESDFIYGSDLLNYFESNNLAMDSFYGTLDGCGHTVSGMQNNIVISSYNYGTVKNLKLYNCISFTGLLFEENEGCISNCIIESCEGIGIVASNSGEMDYCFSNSSSCGICSYNSGTITNSINNSSVTYCGGIAENNEGNIENCINNGSILANGERFVGGICGNNASSNYELTKIKSTVKNCINNGTVKGERYVGGICGITWYSGAVINCLNTGAVSATDTVDKTVPTYWAAGISELQYNGTITCCVNTGRINSGKGYATSLVRSYQVGTTSSSYAIANTGVTEETGTTIVSSANAGKESSYPRLDFVSTWQILNSKPVLQMANTKEIGICVSALPNKIYYNIGEAFDDTGLKVISCDNKGSWNRTYDYKISGFTGNFGKNTITVTKGNFKSSFEVWIQESIKKTTIKLQKSSLPATGKGVCPDLDVIYKGEYLLEGRDYKLAFQNNVKPGVATVRITGINSFKDTVSKTFVITPMKTSGLKVKTKKEKSLVLKWNKQAGVDGYSVEKYNPKTKKYKTYKNVKTNSVTVKKLTPATKYKFRVRSYKKINGKTYYGAYSKVLSAKTYSIKPGKVKGLSSAFYVDDYYCTIAYYASWDKVNGASGYEVKFGGEDGGGKYWSSTMKLKGASTTSYSTYCNYFSGEAWECYAFVKVRAYKNINGKKVYGKWSKTVYSEYISV